MPVVDLYNLDRQKVGTMELDDEFFGVEVREHLFHEVVRAQLASKRTGSAKTKERWEIRGTQQKAWRQKGTGRARQSSRKAPHWVGGGVVFGPKPRTFEKKVNKKVRRAALAAALSRRQQEGRLALIDEMALAEIKTKQVGKILAAFDASKALIVDIDNKNLELSTRNVAKSHFVPVRELNVYDILRHDHLLMSKAAAEALQKRVD